MLHAIIYSTRFWLGLVLTLFHMTMSLMMRACMQKVYETGPAIIKRAFSTTTSRTSFNYVMDLINIVDPSRNKAEEQLFFFLYHDDQSIDIMSF